MFTLSFGRYTDTYLNSISIFQNKLLKKHMVTHSKSDEGRQHRCPDCNASFKRKDHLNRHITDLHSLIADKLFECSGYPGCNARFRSAGRLKQHLKLHEDNEMYACKNCGKKILRKKNLNIHMITCHGPASETNSQYPSLKCLACDFTYSHPSKLEAHLAANPDHNLHAALSSSEDSSCDEILDLSSTTSALLDEFVNSLLLSDSFLS